MRRVEQIMLIIAGLAGIGAFFLPFLHVEKSLLGVKLLDVHVSGYSYVLAWLDFFDLHKQEGARAMIDLLGNLWQSISGIKGYAQVIGLFVVLTGPIFYLLLCLGYLIRGFTGGSFKRGVMFNLLFMGLAWGVFFWISRDKSHLSLTKDLNINLDVSLNFFDMAGPGFWVAFAAVFVAGFSLIFSKKL